ncbi:HAD family hydrolase [Candidatus Woesearchaeota archaeon]|nr:HAD family hydrolase [bacterium]MBT7556676.1 HAD family hydrolase [Candidatus Woesearchaeota archaeon]
MVNLKIDQKLLSNIDLVVFDKDGTLFDLHKYWSFVIIERAKYFSNICPRPESGFIYSELLAAMGLGENNMINSAGPVGVKSRNFIINLVYKIINDKNTSISIKDVEDGFIVVDSIVDNNFKSIVEKLPGIDDLMLSLKESGCLISLATSDIRKRAIKALKYSQIFHYFDYIIGSDNVVHAKPNSEMIDKILSKLNIVNRSNVVLIGDSVTDLNTAKNSGVNFIGVMTGSSSNEFIQKSDFLVDDLSKIKAMADVN